MHQMLNNSEVNTRSVHITMCFGAAYHLHHQGIHPVS